MTTQAAATAGKGTAGAHNRQSHRRLVLSLIGFLLVYATIAFRLLGLGFEDAPRLSKIVVEEQRQLKSRPDIVDRHGTLLAADVMTASLFANPSKINDVDEVSENLLAEFPDLKFETLQNRLRQSKKQFVWIKRGLSPRQQERVHDLGLPGLGFVPELGRVYPANQTAAHLLGIVDVDNRGLSGIEAYIENVSGLYLPRSVNRHDKPAVQMSIDLGAQHALRQELSSAMHRYRSKAAVGIVLDVNSGEILAMSSLPDFDPHQRSQALETERYDRVSKGTFELGSVMKVITVAIALELGTATLDKIYDVSEPIRKGRHQIDDYHGQKRPLTLQEVFIHSSNIGTAKMALEFGKEWHLSFLRKLNMVEPLKTEIGVSKRTELPKHWTDVHSMTISYGHGISTTPLQFATAVAALVNGGFAVHPTFLKASKEGRQTHRKRIISAETSDQIRGLMRQNVVAGTGKSAEVDGYRVGGKTGSAEKVIGGKYDTNALLTSFVGIFPADNPAYLTFIMLDEPQAEANKKTRPTAGKNATIVTARLINRIGPMLGVVPAKEFTTSFDENRRPPY